MEMAHYLFQSGNPNKAISQMQAIHRKAADDAVAANLLGQYYLAMHNYAAAETVLRDLSDFLTFYDFPQDGYLIVSLITPDSEFQTGILALLQMVE